MNGLLKQPMPMLFALGIGGEAAFFGYGCEKDLDKAKQYFSRFMCHAVPFKSDYETYFLGQCYMHGWGIESDIPEAISLFRSLGNQCGDALHALGLIYQDLDAVQAKQYFLRALQVGCLKTPFALYEMYGFDLQHFPYPNDYEWNMRKFRELAQKYYHLSQTCKS